MKHEENQSCLVNVSFKRDVIIYLVKVAEHEFEEIIYRYPDTGKFQEPDLRYLRG